MLRIFLSIVAIVLLLSSCSKNGEPIEQMKHTNLQIRALTVDTLLLKVELDDEIVINRTTAPSISAISNIKYTDPAHRFRITNLYDNRVLLDTTIMYRGTTVTPVNLVQTGANARMVLVGPAANEPPPPAGKIKMSVVYVATMPDEVKVVAENSQSGASDLDYVATDSFLLKKGEFSPYVQGWDANRRKPKLKVYTSDAQRVLLAEFKAGLFYEAQSGISIYSLERITTNFNGATKLY